MKKTIITASILLLAVNNAFADTWVNGYTRSDGTYVNGYYRTRPNYTKLDNYSTKGNYNPYTGKAGTIKPYNDYGTTFNSTYLNRMYSNRID